MAQVTSKNESYKQLTIRGCPNEHQKANMQINDNYELFDKAGIFILFCLLLTSVILQ